MKTSKALRILALILSICFVFATSASAIHGSDGIAQPPTGSSAGGSSGATFLYAMAPSLMAASNDHILHSNGTHADRSTKENVSERKVTALTAELTLLWLVLLLFVLFTWHVVSTAPLPGKKKPLLSLSMGGNSPPVRCA